MWPTSHLHAPRRSHEQHSRDTTTSRSSSPDGSTESRRRTSSDATPRQTPATTRFLNNNTDHDIPRNVLASSTLTVDKSEGFSSSKRLGFLADKLTSSLSGTGKDSSANSSKISLHPSQLLHPHSHHSRVESNPTSSSLTSTTLGSPSNSPAVNKPQTSPSKPPYGRTYDPKLVSREMHRLNLAHHPSALGPQLSTAPSVASLSLVAPPSNISQTSISSATVTDPWNALHVHLLPLFNGEPLRMAIEELNVLVRRHVQSVVSNSPPRALATLENDASELIAAGMVTLNAKLTGIEDDKLVARVVEVWGFFWDQVLTYLEGVLLPLQTDSLLLSLYRTPKAQRTTSPTRQTTNKLTATSTPATPQQIDVRSLALRSFRDKVIFPLFQRLYMRLTTLIRTEGLQDAFSYQLPRLQQMLLVLVSQSRQLPLPFSLTTPAAPLNPADAAVRDLLRLVRTPRPQLDKFKNSPAFQTRTPTFLSTGVPRDRRGRVAMKHKPTPSSLGLTNTGLTVPDDQLGEDLPGLGSNGYVDIEREQNQGLLEALRSPDVVRRPDMGWVLASSHVVDSPTQKAIGDDHDEDDETVESAAG